MTEVYIAGTKVDIVSDITVKRSVSDLICSASFSTPLDLLSAAQSRSAVVITRNGETLFNGLITSYSISYQGKALQLSIDCSDRSWILAHSLLPLTDTESSTITTMTGRLTFDPTAFVGDVIASLLYSTGIVDILSGESTSHIGLRDVLIPETCLVFDPGTTKLDVIDKICSEIGALFYIKFVGADSVAVCDVWTNLANTPDFTNTVSVSDATHLVKSFNLNSVPEMVCTRVTEEIADDTIETNHAESSTGSAPYIDKFIKIDPNTTINISTDVIAKRTQYANCVERGSITIVGTPLHLFNIANLGGLFDDIGISPTVESYRVTDSTVTISDEGVYTDATLISSSAEIIDGIVAKATGTYDPEVQIATSTTTAISAASARLAKVTSTGTGTVTVQYAGGTETETLKDRSV